MSNISLESKRDEILDRALTRIGSDWTLDAIYLFAFPILGLIPFAFNILSYIIFKSPHFSQKKSLYIYLKVSCLNSSVINLITAINFLWSSQRYFKFANSQLAVYLRCYLRFPIILSAYSFGSLIDIVLALERLCELTNSKRLFNRARPFCVCAVTLILSVCFNLTIIFMCEPKRQVLVIDAGSNYTVEFFYLGKTSFSTTKFGVTTRYIRFIIRDILTLLLLFGINLAAFVNFRRKYYTQTNMNSIVNSIRADEEQTSNRLISNPSASSSSKSSNNTTSMLPVTLVTRVRFTADVMKANKMLTKMVVIICAFSAFEHLFLILAIQIFELEPIRYRLIRLVVMFMTNLAMLLKNSINFFIFYHYNARFRMRFKKLLNSCLRRFT